MVRLIFLMAIVCASGCDNPPSTEVVDTATDFPPPFWRGTYYSGGAPFGTAYVTLAGSAVESIGLGLSNERRRIHLNFDYDRDGICMGATQNSELLLGENGEWYFDDPLKEPTVDWSRIKAGGLQISGAPHHLPELDGIDNSGLAVDLRNYFESNRRDFTLIDLTEG